MNIDPFRPQTIEDLQTKDFLTTEINHLCTISHLIREKSTQEGWLVIIGSNFSWSNGKCNFLKKIDTFQKMTLRLSNLAKQLNPNFLEKTAFKSMSIALNTIFEWMDLEFKDSSAESFNRMFHFDFNLYVVQKEIINLQFDKSRKLRTNIKKQIFINENVKLEISEISQKIFNYHTEAQLRIKNCQMSPSDINSYINIVKYNLNELNITMKKRINYYIDLFPCLDPDAGFRWSELESTQVKKFLLETEELKQIYCNLQVKIVEDLWNADHDYLSFFHQLDDLYISERLSGRDKINEQLYLCEQLIKYCQSGKTSQNIAMAFSKLTSVLVELKSHKNEYDELCYKLFNLRNFPAFLEEIISFRKECLNKNTEEWVEAGEELNRYHQSTKSFQLIDMMEEKESLNPVMARYALIQDQFEILKQKHSNLAVNEDNFRYLNPLKLEFNNPLFEGSIDFNSPEELRSTSKVYSEYIETLKDLYSETAWLSRFLSALPSLEFPKFNVFQLFS